MTGLNPQAKIDAKSSKYFVPLSLFQFHEYQKSKDETQ
jgi:hypothetical protein